MLLDLSHSHGYTRKANLLIFKLKDNCHKVLSWAKFRIILLRSFTRLVAWINYGDVDLPFVALNLQYLPPLGNCRFAIRGAKLLIFLSMITTVTLS